MLYACLVLLQKRTRKSWLQVICQPGFLSFFKSPFRAHLVQEAFPACFQSGLGAPSSNSFSVLCTSFSMITDGPLLCWFTLFTSLKPELCKDRDHVFCSVHPNTWVEALVHSQDSKNYLNKRVNIFKRLLKYPEIQQRIYASKIVFRLWTYNAVEGLFGMTKSLWGTVKFKTLKNN